MTFHRWLLPESIEDVLPQKAQRIEQLRRTLLDEFRVHGYQLIMPPMLEYVESLLTGSGRDLDLRTLKLVDQLSGRTLGIRADITPQVARIDSHLLNRQGVARLCYCGSVLHALPSGLMATREPLQIGAELYGHAQIEADIEIVHLLGRALELADVQASRIDLGHVGVFHALSAGANIGPELEEELFAALQAKDISDLHELLRDVAEPVRSALLSLPECYGGLEVLDRIEKRLPGNTALEAALGELRGITAGLAGLPISFDLADLRGYHYHSGFVFAAYCTECPGAIAQGGRYDRVGRAFGRGRPATGFSLDLRGLVRINGLPESAGAILAPIEADSALAEMVTRLRADGTVVINKLPGHEGTWGETECDRQITKRDNQWVIEPIKGKV